MSHDIPIEHEIHRYEGEGGLIADIVGRRRVDMPSVDRPIRRDDRIGYWSTPVTEPCNAAQAAFLASTADIVVIGGPCGVGKTHALLLAAAKHVDKAGGHAVFFRRTRPQLTNPGGTLDMARRIYPHLGGYETGLSWGGEAFHFERSSATIRFSTLWNREACWNWGAAQIPTLCLDNLTDFDEEQFWFMLSRNRSPYRGIKRQAFATIHDEYAPWTEELLKPWLSPSPAKSGEVRHFVRNNGRTIFLEPSEHRGQRQPNVKSITFIDAGMKSIEMQRAFDRYGEQPYMVKDPIDIEPLINADECELPPHWRESAS